MDGVAERDALLLRERLQVVRDLVNAGVGLCNVEVRGTTSSASSADRTKCKFSDCEANISLATRDGSRKQQTHELDDAAVSAVALAAGLGEPDRVVERNAHG